MKPITIGSGLTPTSILAFAAILFLLSCDDDIAGVGFKDPNSNVQVFAKEFTIPVKTFLMDSVITSNSASTPTSRLMVGYREDANFGKTTATAIAQYWPTTAAPKVSTSAVFQKLELTLVYDFYWNGSSDNRNVTYSVHELADSVLSYIPHFSNETTAIGGLIGQTTRLVSPSFMDESVADNTDTDTSNDLIDSLNVDLTGGMLGRRLLAAAMDTAGIGTENFLRFNNFRRVFKGIAIQSSGAANIHGFNHTAAKSRITLTYKVDTTVYKLNFTFAGYDTETFKDYQSYTHLSSDRSGTPLAGLTNYWQDFDAPDGRAYVQGGTGVMAKLDFSEVHEFFKTQSVLALSVAELSVSTDEQTQAPAAFSLRVLRPDNRHLKLQTKALDAAGDSYLALNGEIIALHALYRGSLSPIRDVFTGPLTEVMGDDALLFGFKKQTTTGKTEFKGFLTNYLQQELTLSDTQFFRYYALVPQSPDMGKCVSSLHFPKDAVKLKIYYTTPQAKE